MDFLDILVRWTLNEVKTILYASFHTSQPQVDRHAGNAVLGNQKFLRRKEQAEAPGSQRSIWTRTCMLGCETYGHLGCLLCLPCSISDLGVFQNQRQLESLLSNDESCLGILPPSSGCRDLLGPITLPSTPNTPYILIWCSWPRGSACSPLWVLSAEPSIL